MSRFFLKFVKMAEGSVETLLLKYKQKKYNGVHEHFSLRLQGFFRQKEGRHSFPR